MEPAGRTSMPLGNKRSSHSPQQGRKLGGRKEDAKASSRILCIALDIAAWCRKSLPAEDWWDLRFRYWGVSGWLLEAILNDAESLRIKKRR
jgi:hypothetical protein